MASCRACGAGIGRQFRFCSQCGVAAGVELDLLDLAPPAHDEATVSYGRPGRFWAAVGGGGLAVVLGLWALSSLGGGGASATDDATDHRPATTAEAGTPPTTEAGPTAPSTAEEAAATTGGAGASTSVIADGGPLLGEPIGLSLLIGSEQRLRRVDLDTGVVTTYERPGVPLLATGDKVVLQSPGGSIRAAPVQDIEAEPDALPRAWSANAAGWVRPGPKPGQAWLADQSSRSLVWRLVDLSSGEVLQEIDAGPSPVWFAASGLLDPMVVGSSTGGVFERNGDGYRRVADGELLAVGRSTVLVRRCDDPESCTLRWIDRASWRELSTSLPAIDAREVAAAVVSDDGRILLYSTNSRSVLFDVSRNAEVAEVNSYPDNLSTSSDGRYVAVIQIAGRLGIYDLEQGELIDVPVSTSDAGRVVFLPG